MTALDATLEIEDTGIEHEQVTQQFNLAYLLSAPLAKAEFKNQAEDFQVEEKLKFDLTGEGQHLCLFIEKKYLNTLDVVEILARFFQVPKRSIGYFGLKDKNSVARQWFSVDLADSHFDENHCQNFDEQFPALLGKGRDAGSVSVRILENRRNIKKFKIGQHGSNIFHIVLREIQSTGTSLTGDALQKDIDLRLQLIRENGFANYFGEQRFGLKNVSGERQNIAMLKQHARSNLSKNRQMRSRLISTLRSLVFNQYLSARIQQGTCSKYLQGDVLQFSDGHSLLRVNPEDKTLSAIHLQKRLDAQQVVVTGPLPGINGSMASEESLLLEEAITKNFQEYLVLLKNNEVNSSRRALISFPQNLQWHFENSNLFLSFELSVGCFATALIREVLDI